MLTPLTHQFEEIIQVKL